jgi:hypothetical protein
VNSETGKAHEQSKADNSTDKVSPIPSDPSSIADVPAHDTEKHTTNQPDWRRRLYWMQFAVFLVGIVIAIIYGCQLNEIRKSTQAATEAVKFARANAHLDQRAWVAPISIAGKPEEGQPYKIKVDIANSGKTFAKRFRGVALVKYKTLSSPDPDFASEAEHGIPGESVLLGPNARFTYTVELFRGQKLTKDYMDFLRAPGAVILVFGKMIYWDIFNCEHWTTFCAQCGPDGECRTYGPYNNADDNRCP